jgi:hypothetical protein
VLIIRVDQRAVKIKQDRATHNNDLSDDGVRAIILIPPRRMSPLRNCLRLARSRNVLGRQVTLVGDIALPRPGTTFSARLTLALVPASSSIAVRGAADSTRAGKASLLTLLVLLLAARLLLLIAHDCLPLIAAKAMVFPAMEPRNTRTAETHFSPGWSSCRG